VSSFSLVENEALIFFLLENEESFSLLENEIEAFTIYQESELTVVFDFGKMSVTRRVEEKFVNSHIDFVLSHSNTFPVFLSGRSDDGTFYFKKMDATSRMEVIWVSDLNHDKTRIDISKFLEGCSRMIKHKLL
jgi:hypothetical protein